MPDISEGTDNKTPSCDNDDVAETKLLPDKDQASTRPKQWKKKAPTQNAMKKSDKDSEEEFKWEDSNEITSKEDNITDPPFSDKGSQPIKEKKDQLKPKKSSMYQRKLLHQLMSVTRNIWTVQEPKLIQTNNPPT